MVTVYATFGIFGPLFNSPSGHSAARKEGGYNEENLRYSGRRKLPSTIQHFFMFKQYYFLGKF